MNAPTLASVTNEIMISPKTKRRSSTDMRHRKRNIGPGDNLASLNLSLTLDSGRTKRLDLKPFLLKFEKSSW